MSTFNTEDMAAALPAAPPAANTGPTGQTPQQYGWVDKTVYDYNTYNKTSRELAGAYDPFDGAPATLATGEEIEEAVGGIRPGEWANNAAIYQWEDEFGDVGPAHPELEKMLFGSANHVKSGINFKAWVHFQLSKKSILTLPQHCKHRGRPGGCHPHQSYHGIR